MRLSSYTCPLCRHIPQDEKKTYLRQYADLCITLNIDIWGIAGGHLVAVWHLVSGFVGLFFFSTDSRIACLHAAALRNWMTLTEPESLCHAVAHANFLSDWHRENTSKAIKWVIFTINGKIKYRLFSMLGRFDALSHQLRLGSTMFGFGAVSASDSVGFGFRCGFVLGPCELLVLLGLGNGNLIATWLHRRSYFWPSFA